MSPTDPLLQESATAPRDPHFACVTTGKCCLREVIRDRSLHAEFKVMGEDEGDLLADGLSVWTDSLAEAKAIADRERGAANPAYDHVSIVMRWVSPVVLLERETLP